MPTPDPEDREYFIFGKNRIKITEHFAQDGKPLLLLFECYIIEKSLEKDAKTA